MDFSQSYYPGQFLEDTAPLLDLDPSLLPEDEFDLSGLDNGAPPPASAGFSSAPYADALPPNGLAASYLGANAPAFSLGTGVPAVDNSAGLSSGLGAFNAPPLQLGPTPQSGPSESALPPWADYLAPEIRQLLAATPRPQPSEDTPIGAYTKLPTLDDWLKTRAPEPEVPAGTEVDQTAPFMESDGGQPAAAGTPLGRVGLGEVSMGIPVSRRARAASAPPLPAPAKTPEPFLAGDIPLQGASTQDGFVADGNDQNAGTALGSPDAAWPWGESSEGVPLDPYGEPIAPANDSGNPTLKIVNLGGRQMIETSSGLVPLENSIPTPPPGAGVPVNLDELHERMRALARQKQAAAQQNTHSLATALAGSDGLSAQSRSGWQNPTNLAAPPPGANDWLAARPFLPEKSGEAAWAQRTDGQIVLNPGRPADALRQLNAAGWLSDGEYRRRLPDAQSEQMAAIARALHSSAPTAMAEPFGRDPLFAPPPHVPAVWSPLAPRKIGPEEAPLQIEAGQIFLDKTRYPQALKEALVRHLISPEVYNQAMHSAYLVQAAALEDRRLRRLAGPDAEANALVAGLGEGAVSVGAGALTGAGVAAVAPESGFTSLALVPGAAMAAGDTAGQVYDSVLPESWQAAAKLHPWLFGGGELAPLVATAPIGLAKALRAARLLQQSQGTLAAAKLLAKPGAAGALGTAAAQGMNKLADPDGSHFSPDAIVLGGALGPASAGLGLKGRNYTGEELASIWSRGTQAAANGLEPSAVLSPSQSEVFNAMAATFQQVLAQRETLDPASFDIQARQMLGRGNPLATGTAAQPASAGPHGDVPVGAVAVDLAGVRSVRLGQPGSARGSIIPEIPPTGQEELSVETESYKILRKKLAKSGLQANHLNQHAAYKGIISKKEGIAVAMRGNAFTDIWSPHYKFHASLEHFWDQYRKGGKLFGRFPTNSEYGVALEKALMDGSFPIGQARHLAERAAIQRAEKKLAPSARVPHIPGRLPQAKPKIQEQNPN